MLGMTLYKLTQAISDKNSLLHWCYGVCWQWQYVAAHVSDIIYLHLSSVSNLHLILGNLLLLVGLNVGPWPQAPSPWPWQGQGQGLHLHLLTASCS